MRKKMKIKLKDQKNPIKRHSTYGGFGEMVSAALNRGEVVEIEQIPELSKNLVEEVSAKPKKEIDNGS